MDTPLHETEQNDSATPTDRLWTAEDLARYVSCSVREIRNLRYAGLPTIKFRHLIRFEPEAVKAWLREPRP
jgi:hypothetical protein